MSKLDTVVASASPGRAVGGDAGPESATRVFAFVDSKLRPPKPRAGSVERSALIHRLRTSSRPLVVLTAPPGYGKTTLLSSWQRREQRQFAWLTVDETDNDPESLLTYLALALDRLGADCSELFEALTAPTPQDARTSTLARSLASLREEIVIVVDDAHTLTTAPACSVLTRLADALPPGSQLALASRRDSLVLECLRADRPSLELGIAELGLTANEAGLLLRGVGVELEETAIQRLNRQVEGWAAAVYLAALSFGAQRAAGATRYEFDGADRFVRDYLELEILSGLSRRELEAVRSLSVLDHICTPLADTVLDSTGSVDVLSSLAQQGLVIRICGPTRSGEQCFRLHGLLREALGFELERDDPGRARELRRRASSWYAATAEGPCANGDSEETAIRYAYEAGDLDLVVALIEERLPQPFGAERIASYTTLLAGLECGDLLAAHPVVAAFGARIHALSGRPEAAARCALLAERSLDDGVERPEATAFALIVRATLCRDGIEAMHADAARAVAASAERGRCRATALLLLGCAELLRGDPERADLLLADAVADATPLEAPDTIATALTERALIAAHDGQWDRVERWVTRATDSVREAGLEEDAASAIVFAAAARVELRRGDRLLARRHLERAHTLLPLTVAIPWFSAQVRLELADAHLALDDRLRAEALLAEVDELVDRATDLGTLAAHLDALRAQLERERGPGDAPAGLTRAERRLLPLLATHLTFREIAGELAISRNTVKTQAISVYRKLRVCSRAEAIEAASALDLIAARSLQLSAERDFAPR